MPVPATSAVTAWLAIWIVLSVSIIIVNKHIMFYTEFKFPFCLAFWHMLLASCISNCAMRLRATADPFNELGSKMVHAQLVVIGVLFAAVLAAGNAALLFLTVPTVQMLKAAGPATIYLMGMAMGTESFDALQAIKVLVVCTGVAIASWGDVSLSLIGFILQASSIMMDAIRCCYLQKVLQLADVTASPLVTLAHVAPFSAVALCGPTLIMEGSRLLATFSAWRAAVPLVLLSGLLASALNLVIFRIIALTSALTTSLSGVLKEWACILVAIYVYDTRVALLQWLGYSIAISGLVWYQVGRMSSAQRAEGKEAGGTPPRPPKSSRARLQGSRTPSNELPLLIVAVAVVETGDVALRKQLQ